MNLLKAFFGGAQENPARYRDECERNEVTQNMRRYQEERFRHIEKARKLCADLPPEFNIEPLVDLVATAERMGFDVVKRV